MQVVVKSRCRAAVGDGESRTGRVGTSGLSTIPLQPKAGPSCHSQHFKTILCSVTTRRSSCDSSVSLRFLSNLFSCLHPMTYLHCLIYSQKSIFQHSIVVLAPLQTWCILLISVRSSSPTALERLITKNSSPQTSKTKEHVTVITDQTLISEIWGKSVSAKQECLGKA